MLVNVNKMESESFNEKFEVKSDDEVESRYLVTPSFMERLEFLQVAYESERIQVSFYEDNVIISITTGKNLFEIGNLFAIFKPKQMKQFFDEIISIILIIKQLKLDEKTGL